MSTNGGIPASCVGCKRPIKKPKTVTLAIPEENGAEKPTEEALAKNLPEEDGEGNPRRSISLHIGIIDCLSKYTFRRAVKLVMRCQIKKECEKKDQSQVHPLTYAARFKCNMNRDIFRVEDGK
jgi:hypothetical protein